MKLSFRKKLNQAGVLSLHVVLPVLAAVIIVGGVGAYVLNKSHAASWTYLNTQTIKKSGTKSVTTKVYACKQTVPKKGIQLKTMLVVSGVSGTGTATNVGITLGTGTIGWWRSAFIPPVVGKSITYTVPRYFSSSETAKVFDFYPSFESGGRNESTNAFSTIGLLNSCT